MEDVVIEMVVDNALRCKRRDEVQVVCDRRKLQQGNDDELDQSNAGSGPIPLTTSLSQNMPMSLWTTATSRCYA